MPLRGRSSASSEGFNDIPLSPPRGEGGVRGMQRNARRFAKNLRRNQTDAERKLWRHLRNRRCAAFKFRRQHILGLYIVDFICLEQKRIVEIDGGQHAAHIHYDAKRTAFLESLGFNVIRFWNNDVLNNIDGVLEVIHDALTGSPHPDPLPEREREKIGPFHSSPSPLSGERAG